MMEAGAFADTIEELIDTSAAPSARWRKSRIRVMIIDTGIDKTDVSIQVALEREEGGIVKCRGFVNKPDNVQDDVQDTLGHGTHVAKLILKLAPSAEVYIAKIADEKTVNNTDLRCIAEVRPM